MLIRVVFVLQYSERVSDVEKELKELREEVSYKKNILFFMKFYCSFLIQFKE